MKRDEVKIKERTEYIKKYLLTHGTTKGLVLTGINCDESFISFIKSNADKFKDIKFFKRGGCEEKDN